MATSESLGPDEVYLLGQHRRLKRDAHDAKLEIFYGFKEKVRTIEFRPCAYVRMALPSMTEAAFEAVD